MFREMLSAIADHPFAFAGLVIGLTIVMGAAASALGAVIRR